MTITTDSELVRKSFEPLCPSNKVRLKAITQIHESGINSCITMTPLLPVENPHYFAQSLLETGVQKFIIQPFHADRGKFVASTREDATRIIRDMHWDNDRYLQTVQTIRQYIPNLREGKDGFAPI
jgi:DNA repair photolyase